MSSNDSLDSITTTTTQLTVESRKHFFSFFTTLNFWFQIQKLFFSSTFPLILRDLYSLLFLFCLFFNKHFRSKDFFKFSFLSSKGSIFPNETNDFLVMCKRLYTPLCRLVGRSQELALFDFQVKRERILIFFSFSAFRDLRMESEISQNGW